MGGYKSKNALYVVVKNREKRVTGGRRQGDASSVTKGSNRGQDLRRVRRYARVRPSGRVRWADGRRVLRPPSYMGVGKNCVHKIRNGTTPQG
jgi:hypothetical protein